MNNEIDTPEQNLSLHDVVKQMHDLQVRVEQQNFEIRQERQRYEDILRNILPDEVYRELLVNGKVVPQYYKDVTVMFVDFVNFTARCEHIDLQQLIEELNLHFSHFDDICEKHYLEKIKTIGDAYLCAGGIPMRNHSHPFDAILAAKEMLNYLDSVNTEKRKRGEELWTVRIGIHTGALVAGVVGKRKFLYDIWGDTVNVASRMESNGEAGKINISEATFKRVSKFFDCSFRGNFPVKNKGNVNMYFVERFNKEYSSDKEGVMPNKDFNNAIERL